MIAEHNYAKKYFLRKAFEGLTGHGHPIDHIFFLTYSTAVQARIKNLDMHSALYVWISSRPVCTKYQASLVFGKQIPIYLQIV